jgi:hypothetical protein
MSDALNRAETLPRLGGGVSQRRGALCGSTEMGNHYRRMAEHYITLAEAEDLGTLAYSF